MAGRAVVVAVLTGALLACFAPAVGAAYPGANGRIAFVTAGEIWTINPDGSDPLQITSPTPPLQDGNPSWSPDGTRIAFDRGSSNAKDLYVVNADGTGESLLTANGRDPTWSPDGTEIAFLSEDSGGTLWRIDADGTNRRFEVYTSNEFDCCALDPAWSPREELFVFGVIASYIVCDPFDPIDCDGAENKRIVVREPNPLCSDCTDHFAWGLHPDWSPNGAELTHTTARVRIDYYTWSGIDGDIAAVSADGTTGQRTIVAGPETDEQPAWSPDGTKIVFRRSSGTATGLWVVGADGSNPVRILELGSQPDWQPVQRPHVRPVNATPTRVSLVPSFTRCTNPNRVHGPPLEHPSCNPPQTASPTLVVRDVENRSVGWMRFAVQTGAQGPPDDSDLRLLFNYTNVINRSDLSDYTGILQPRAVVRLTDKDGFQRQTTKDFPFGFQVPCAATASTTDGGVCQLTTSAETVLPGSITEGSRAVWALDQVQVYDGGPAGDGANASLFAVQGVFVP